MTPERDAVTERSTSAERSTDDVAATEKRLRAGLERVIDFYRRQSDGYRPGRGPTELAAQWRDGHIAASASCSLIAREALNPEGWAEHQEDMQTASHGTDREWFERTGNCGHCGMLASHCACTPDDPCGCGPHEPSAWPLDCWACGGVGKQDPRLPREALASRRPAEQRLIDAALAWDEAPVYADGNDAGDRLSEACRAYREETSE